VRLLSALDRFRVESGLPGAPNDVAQQARVRARLERSMDAREFTTAWQRGAMLTIDDAGALTDEELAKLED
jgi:hypothetical protein